MKFTGAAENIANQLVELFRNGNPGEAMANVFLKTADRHCSKWSWNNQLLTILSGYSDAMGFRQWQEFGRTVKKGEKAFYILAPLSCKGEREVRGVKESYTFIRGFRGLAVFGYEQTEGEPIEYNKCEHLNTLPLLEVAKSWGIEVGAYNGLGSVAAGYYSPSNLKIMLGVENLTTWFHELVHAAEFRNGALTNENYAANKADAEIVAEFGATILAHCLGLGDKADNGGCFKYVSSYSKGVDTAEKCYKLIDRTCKAVNEILNDSEESEETEETINNVLQEV